jgi:Domain of unknown function (DUF6089)
MKNHCCILLLVSFICLRLNGQYYFSGNNNNEEPELLWELGTSIGAMNCLTDLGGAKGIGKKFIKDINWGKTQFCGGLFVSATWHSLIAVRMEGIYGQVTASDDVLKNVYDIARERYLRNLHFKSAIAEIALTTEFHPLFLNTAEDAQAPLFSPYLTAGFGIFHYNPQTMFNNNWVDLRPLHTEGQGFREYPDRPVYKSTSWCVPMGVGIKYDKAGMVNYRFEIVYRMTGTDYLDDVSTNYINPELFTHYLPAQQAAMAMQLTDRSKNVTGINRTKEGSKRGNPNDKDAYFTFSIKLSMALNRGKRK